MTGGYERRVSCSLCRGCELERVLDLGWTPLANEYSRTNDQEQEVFPLDVVLCKQCGHSQIGVVVNPERLFGDYAYATATSPVTVKHIEDEARWIKSWYESQVGLRLYEKSLVVEIGSNDGTMLKALRELGVGRVVGVDPASKKLAAEVDSLIEKEWHVNEAFGRGSGQTIKSKFGEADVVVANNVLAHVPSVRDVVQGVSDLLADGGVFVFEVSYLMDMAEEPLFDTIYHEHMSYHAVKPLALMLDEVGLPIRTAMRLPEQKGRGSLRVACVKGPWMSIDAKSVRDLMFEEAKLGLWDKSFWAKTCAEIWKARDQLRNWIDSVRSFGQKVVGYGAPAKLTTLMYALGLDLRHVDFIVDDSPWKQGLYTPGTHIPIRHPSALKEVEEATCIVFAWNFWKSIVTNHQDFDGRFLVPLPEMFEVNAEDVVRCSNNERVKRG